MTLSSANSSASTSPPWGHHGVAALRNPRPDRAGSRRWCNCPRAPWGGPLPHLHGSEGSGQEKGRAWNGGNLAARADSPPSCSCRPAPFPTSDGETQSCRCMRKLSSHRQSHLAQVLRSLSRGEGMARCRPGGCPPRHPPPRSGALLPAVWRAGGSLPPIEYRSANRVALSPGPGQSLPSRKTLAKEVAW
jgi:hypothetical protein